MENDNNPSDEDYSEDENSSPRDNSNQKENRIEALVNKSSGKDNKKFLYENIGTRVSRLREINEGYEKKILEQEAEIKRMDEKIKAKREILEVQMRGHGEKKDQIKLNDPKWVNELYEELIAKQEIKMHINQNHIKNDPALKKAYQQKESELSQLKNQLNTLVKKTDHIKNEINVLRIENNKHKNNLDLILEKKEKQNKEMNIISKEANEYLAKKGDINKELIQLNKDIDKDKAIHEGKMQELNKMIDNTKKIKEFHETLAYEKFSNNSFKNTNTNKNESGEKKPASKMAEEQQKLEELEQELTKAKRMTVYLNLSKLILLKKQSELNLIIDKVKKETGIDNLDKLSSDLQLSTKTNSLFENDLKSLHKQKTELEHNIEIKKKEIQSAYCILNDTSTKKTEYMDKLEKDLQLEQDNKVKLNKRLFALNRMIELMSKGFKNICEKLNFFDKTLKFESETSEGTLTKCMDFLEKKMIEIIQLNTDPLKDTNISDNDEAKNMVFLQKIRDGMSREEHEKMIDKKKCLNSNFSLREIKDISKDMVNAYIKRFDLTNK